jgi:hypothetical protein
MKEGIFVFTASGPSPRRHRERTIDQVVRFEEIEPISARIANALRTRGFGDVRCWGSVPTEGNRATWQRMRPGHWGLLYGSDRRFPWLLRVGYKDRSKTLARALWEEDSKGQTWELMFFFDLALPVDLSLEEVREAFAYEGDTWRPQGLHYPAAEHQAAVLEKFGSLEAFAAAVAGVAPEEAGAAALSPRERLMGGEYKGPPAKPPRTPKDRLPPDPDRTGRGFMAHEATVQKLRTHIGRSFRKGTLGINHDGAWEADGGFCISEVKSIIGKNESGQLQKGLGQVLHNRFKAQESGIDNVKAYLIAEREPVSSDAWKRLCRQCEVVFTWPERFGVDVPKP